MIAIEELSVRTYLEGFKKSLGEGEKKDHHTRFCGQHFFALANRS